MTTSALNGKTPQMATWLVGLALGCALWLATYGHLTDFVDAMIAALSFAHVTAIGEARHFFFYDTSKVLLLLTGIVFLMGIIQTFFSPERTQAVLSGKRVGVGAGKVLAASLGIVTPFCSFTRVRRCCCSSASCRRAYRSASPFPS